MCIDHYWLLYTNQSIRARSQHQPKTERLHCSPWLVACCQTSKKPQGPTGPREMISDLQRIRWIRGSRRWMASWMITYYSKMAIEVDPNINDLNWFDPHINTQKPPAKNHGVQPTRQGASWESTVTMRKLTTPTKPAVMNLKSAGAAGGFFFTFGLPSSDVLKMCWPCNTAGAIFLLGPYWILLTNLQRESTHKFYTFHHFLEDGAHSLKHSFSFCVTYEAKLITTFNRKTTWHHHSRHADLCARTLNTFTIFATQPCNVTAQMM